MRDRLGRAYRASHDERPGKPRVTWVRTVRLRTADPERVLRVIVSPIQRQGWTDASGEFYYVVGRDEVSSHFRRCCTRFATFCRPCRKRGAQKPLSFSRPSSSQHRTGRPKLHKNLPRNYATSTAKRSKSTWQTSCELHARVHNIHYLSSASALLCCSALYMGPLA